jgi:hypothetical protein
MAFPLAAVVGGAQALLGIGSSVFGQAPIDTSAIRQTALQNVAIRLQNERTEKIFRTQLDRVRQQYGRNADAASRAYNSLQLKEQEQLEAYLSQQSGMVKALAELQGRYGAREVYGKSASRLASMPEREYGVAMRTMFDNLTRFSDQIERDIAEVSRQHISANEDAFAGVSVPPMMMGEVPVPSVQMPSQANLGLKIGSAILGGLNTFAALKPPEATNFGMDQTGMSFSGSPMATSNPLSIGGSIGGSYSGGVGTNLGLQSITGNYFG